MDKDSKLATLVEYGYDPVVAQVALEQTSYGDLNVAIDYIYKNFGEGSLDKKEVITEPTPLTSQPTQQLNTPTKPKRQISTSSSKRLKSSITVSAGSDDCYEDQEDSEEEYYQDVDDYEFDIALVDAFPKANTVIQSKDIINTALAEINNISSITETTPSAATLLLCYFQWNPNKLLERYYEDPERVVSAAGIKKIDQFFTKTSVPGQMCSVCADDLDSNNCSYLSCKHYSCDDCWNQYLLIKLLEGGATSIPCMGVKCPSVIPDEFIHKVAPNLYNKYLERLAQTYVDQNPNMRWCPAVGCGNALKADSQSESTAQCSCGFKICFRCKQESHFPADCEQMKNWKKKCEDDSETANWISSNTQDCPKCQSAIEKNGGCNHMTCIKCKHEFCWICLGNWIGHSNCNSYKKEENSNKSELKKNLERYLFYFHRYNTHEQSKKFETKLRQTAIETIVSFQNKTDKRWIDIKFVETSTEILIQCRRTLKYTYVYGYYMGEGTEKNLFEYLQNDLEKTTEQLSFLLSQANSDLKIFDLKEMTNLASVKLKHLLEGVEEGFIN
ncbi:ubiquitin-protein ligase [Dictyostelium purpureum]|uniref:RBR-type E3 ubiquitin transferase n=1 Tax=Dictyostelium purpureum TaxID=5786 RepID=F0ZMD1_DICPU|nr:ubiquitin-protein ligase [Dictyostelium purpureum]EGC34895.1 ubiquitin-protein ligase [Dictyostelium purpureum]|eukprot:XP_003288587.1 ubiquitin-protein ligase [Dictyostelium purpureum]